MQRRQGTSARTTNGGRASVKNQRRVNNQQPVRNVAKKKPQQKENNAKQQNHVAPVGVSGVPLSARFSTLQKEAVVQQHVPATKKKNVVVNVKKNGLQPKVVAKKPVARNAKQQQKVQVQQKQQQQKQKMQQVTQANRTKRQATVNQRRKGLEVAVPAKAAKKTKANGTAAAPANKKNAPKPKSRPGQKGKEDKKKAPVTGEDLDVEMDSYWHQAGKGPDPQQALLDRQMEEYWAGKPKPAEGESAPQNETTTA